MRLLVARCEVRYSGRLNAVLPEAVRLLILKADGSVLVHDDAGGFKPLNWMTAPTVVEDERRHARRAQAEDGGRARDPARRGAERRRPRHGRVGGAPEGRRRARPAGGARRRARGARRGAHAREARVADRGRPGRPHVQRRRPASGSRSRSSASGRSRRSSSSRATSAFIREDPAKAGCRGILAAQKIKPQAVALAESRGIRCVEVDLALLRGEREPDLTLFTA